MKNENKNLREAADLYSTFIEPFKDAAKVIGAETLKIFASVLTGFHILLFAWGEERINEVMEKHDARMGKIDKLAKDAMERIDSALNRNPDFPVAFMMLAPTSWATRIVVSTAGEIKDAIFKDDDDDADEKKKPGKKKGKEKPSSTSETMKSIAALGLSAAAGAYFASNKSHDEIVADLMKLFFGRNLLESRSGSNILRENEEQGQSSNPIAKKFQDWSSTDEAKEIKDNLKKSILLGIKGIDDEFKKLETIILSLAQSENLEALESKIAEIEKLGIDLKDLKAGIEKAKNEAANELGNPQSKVGATYNKALKGTLAIKQAGKEATPEQAEAINIDPAKQKQEAAAWVFKKIKNELATLKDKQLPEIKKSFAEKLTEPSSQGYPLVPDAKFLKKMGIDLQTFKEGDPELADIWEKTKNKYGIN